MLVEIPVRKPLNTLEVAARLDILFGHVLAFLPTGGCLFWQLATNLPCVFRFPTCAHRLQQAFAAAAVGDLGVRPHSLQSWGSLPPTASHLSKVLGPYGAEHGLIRL